MEPNLVEVFGSYMSWKINEDTWVINFMNGSQNMYLLEEAKNRMAKLNETNGNEDDERLYVHNEGFTWVKRTAVFNEAKLLEMKRRLQIECNSLQDKLDAYNALHKIEFDTPLTD